MYGILAYGLITKNDWEMTTKEKAIKYLESVGDKEKALENLTKMKKDLQQIHGMDEYTIKKNNKQMDVLAHYIVET